MEVKELHSGPTDQTIKTVMQIILEVLPVIPVVHHQATETLFQMHSKVILVIAVIYALALNFLCLKFWILKETVATSVR